MVLALVIVAAILLLLAAFNVPTGPHVSIGWLGLAFWVLSTIWTRLGGPG